ncbi:SRPBCC domain-containing protein [Sphingomonas sp. HF-S3]|uniref:SRPBCC domain-containing protein n=1 Tax=Sphingomonas rustica TaxID=3103142 RepID=A0ABV0BAF3_9SPHN
MTQPDDSAGAARYPTTVERRGERELVVTRVFDAPPELVYRAWSVSDLFRRWWMPKSVTGVTLVGCDMDVRTGGTYRLEFSAGGADTMAFYGKYLEAVPNARIVWTNDEGEDGAVTTVTFEAQGDGTLLTFHEAYPSAQALEEALQGSAAGLPEQFGQLDGMLAEMGA